MKRTTLIISLTGFLIIAAFPYATAEEGNEYVPISFVYPKKK